MAWINRAPLPQGGNCYQCILDRVQYVPTTTHHGGTWLCEDHMPH